MNPTRVAIVTGAAQGVGRATAERLAADGYALVLNDLREPLETLHAVRGGPGAVAVQGDVADEATGPRLLEAALSRFSRADVLVNNAGVSFIRPAETIEPAEWRRVLEVNLTGPFLLCRAIGPHLLARGSGSVVNVASVAGLLGVADRAAYNASKHGLVGLTRTLAAEWGGRGVRVNAVCPGWIKTELDARDMGSGAYTDADIEARVPMARFARPGDVAQAIAFLADDARSGFVNGHTLSVDGGWAADGGWDALRLKHR